MLPFYAGMKYGGVGDDGDRHAVGLLARRLVQMLSDFFLYAFIRFLQNIGGLGNSFF